MAPLITIVSGLISLAPTIGKWFGGDKGEDAAQAVADIARGVTGQNDVAQAIRQVQKDPTAQLEFLKALEQNKYRLDELYLADVADARDSHRQSIFPAVLCSYLTVGLTLFVMALIFIDIPQENMRMIDTVFGSYLTAWISSVGYWVGTTRGSSEKNRKLMK